MKRLFTLLALAALLILGMPAPDRVMQAATVSSTFAATGVSSTLFVPHNQTFRLSLTGSYVATVNVEESNSGGQAYQFVSQFTTTAALDIDAKPYDRTIRLNCTSYTSGTVTYSISNVTYPGGRFRYGTIDIGSVAFGSLGGSTTPVAGTWYMADFYVPTSITISIVAPLNAATVGTNKWICAILDGSGKTLGNTATAGALTAGTDTFQALTLVTPLQLTPGEYYVACQLDGTTDRFRTIAASTFLNVLTTSIAGSFGTVPPAFAVPTTQTAAVGIIAYVQ